MLESFLTISTLVVLISGNTQLRINPTNVPMLNSLTIANNLNLGSNSRTRKNVSVNVLNPIELPPNFQYPNGVTNASDGTIYVGSVTSGQILRINPNGQIETFFPGNEQVFAATSLRLDEKRGILWGTSPDFLGTSGPSGEVIRRPHRLFAIDTRSREVLQIIPIPENGFGNDLALDAEGGVYLTDSTHPRIYYLAPRENQLRIWAEDEQLRGERIGLAGIARSTDGVLIVGHFSSGKLFKVTPQSQGLATVKAISLERKLENPDGMQFAPDGSLLLTEFALESGNGRLLKIDIFSPETQPKTIETLASNLKSPVNLTIAGGKIWVTESQIRHRLQPGKEAEVPKQFFIRRFLYGD